MFCPECGTKIEGQPNHCVKCGKNLTGVLPPQGTPFAAAPGPAATMAPVSAQERRYGGFWIRFVAFIADAIVYSIVTSIVLVPVVMMLGMSLMDLAASGDAPAAGGVGVGAVKLVGFAIPWLYFTLLESSAWQATLGKKMCGLRVTDLNGNRISFLRANGRFFAKILSSMILLIGYLMIAFTAKKQGLHDMIASTLVLKN